MTEIIKELDETPIGKFGFRKRLVKNTDESGNVTYSIRTYAPRPLLHKPDEEVRYVPARGIDLTEDELKDVCVRLREDLYDTRHVDDYIANIESGELLDMKDFDNDENWDEEDFDFDYNVEDPFPDEDFEDELGIETFMPILQFIIDENHTKELKLVSWHGRPIVYDIRVWERQVNSRGYDEFVPCIDKGISLGDIESELLCQGIESLFPDIADKTADLREDDYEEKANTFKLNLTDKESEIAIQAFDDFIEERLVDGLRQGTRGSTIGEECDSRFIDYLNMLRRKLKTGERFFDTEARVCMFVFSAMAESAENDGVQNTLNTLADTIENTLAKRNRLPSFEYESLEQKKLTASAGEFGTAAKVLRLLFHELYNDDGESKEKKDIREEIDAIVTEDIELRNKDRVEFPDKYKSEPGEHFIADLFHAFDWESVSPFTEPYTISWLENDT